MAIRRTKQKETNQFNQSGQLRLTQAQYSYHANGSRSGQKDKKSDVVGPKSLFAYDTSLIFNDLKKTAIITVAIIVLLVVITWYLRR